MIASLVPMLLLLSNWVTVKCYPRPIEGRMMRLQAFSVQMPVSWPSHDLTGGIFQWADGTQLSMRYVVNPEAHFLKYVPTMEKRIKSSAGRDTPIKGPPGSVGRLGFGSSTTRGIRRQWTGMLILSDMAAFMMRYESTGTSSEAAEREILTRVCESFKPIPGIMIAWRTDH